AFLSLLMASGLLFGNLTSVWAGSLVFGPVTFHRTTGKPQSVATAFSVDDPSGTFWLQLSNGSGGVDLVSSARVVLNGRPVLGPSGFSQTVLGLESDVTLQINNVLEVELRVIRGSFLTIEIRRADASATLFNRDHDLWGHKDQDAVALWWNRKTV